ncbi:MAG: sulfatase-like hydrolase/transferase [Candidatus Latescibacterota bacterium]
MATRPGMPNVVVFLTDQQRWDTTGLHGNPMGLTPNLDRLARAHTHVAYSFTCQPVCGPARACLQSGLHATTLGVFRNGLPLPAGSRTLAHCFAAAGYHTAYIGKWHLDQGVGAVPPERRFGYDYWLASNVLEFTSDAYDTVVFDGNERPVKLPGYRSDALIDAAIRYIDAHQRVPFFLFLSFIEPHFQNHLDDYPPPDGYREVYAGGWVPPDLAALGGSTHQHLGGYYGMVKRLDEGYGRLHDALKSLGLSESTIVLFTSDHGCHFRTRNSEYKRSCHESSIRVATVLTGPGFEGGGRVSELVSLLDLPPTLLEAAGLEVPGEMVGRSLLPLLRGQRQGWPEEVFVQISEAQVGRAVRTRRWKYCVDAPDRNGVRDAHADSYVEQYLYDLQADPWELTNLVGLESHRMVADALRDRLLRRLRQAGEEVPRITPAPTRPSGGRRVTAQEAQL